MARISEEKSNDSRAYWQGEIERAISKRYKAFWVEGESTVDEYRMQKADAREIGSQDKYNILYSSTETIRPNLYAQRPKVRVKLRQRDTQREDIRLAAKLLGGALEYVIEEEDLDEVMEAVVEDYLLPGLGTAWVRYSPTFGDALKREDGSEVTDEQGQPVREVIDESVKIEYTYWQDVLFGTARGWKTVPWVARRCWFTKEAATARFGKDKASQLTYCEKTGNNSDSDTGETAPVWEIWCKNSKKAYWYSESYSDGLLDERPDPLKLKAFFPCPRPMRAISNTRTFVPRPFFSQYKSQSKTLNTLTKRIRMLADALRVAGVYDGSQATLSDLLNPAHGNRMIAVDSWAMFAQNGGIRGSVEWLPIEQIVAALVQIQSSREVCKAEIYEITGFSDIVRGVSKASETLGAQNIKANWAGARVRKMQKEVQRFARDLIALAGEIIAEHCDPASIALFANYDMPSAEEISSNPAAQQSALRFKAASDLIHSDIRRRATIDIETDSTILADEEAERKDRTDFLAAAGAFLQQAVPAMEVTPELGPLLGAMLMFVVRTFPASDPIEEEFEKVQQVLANGGSKQKPDPEAAKSQAATGVAQIRAQTDQARIASDAQMKDKELQANAGIDAEKLRLQSVAENNRHLERMEEIALKRQELELREREVSVKEQELVLKHEAQELSERIAEHTAGITEAELDHSINMDNASHELERTKAQAEQSDPEPGEGLTDGET